MATTGKDYIDELDALIEEPSAVREIFTGSGGICVLLALAEDKLADSAIAVARALDERRAAMRSVLYVIELGTSVPEATV